MRGTLDKWDVINEGGEGYRPRPKARPRCALQVQCEISDQLNTIGRWEYTADKWQADRIIATARAKIAVLETELAGLAS